MNPLVSKHSWLVSPVIVTVAVAMLLVTWSVMTPENLQLAFDQDGHSPFELMTLPLFAAIIPLVWLCPPTSGSWRRKTFWNLDFSLIALMALAREEDWHKMLVQTHPELPGASHGTAFKMTFLTNSANPLGDRLIVLAVFIIFFVVVAGTLARFIWPLLKGIFKLHPVAWTMAAFGGVSIANQFFDHFPASWRHAHDGVALEPAARAFCTAFEEGGEMIMAILCLVAILQAHAIYSRDEPPSDFADL